MILVDSSVWVDYFRGTGSKEAETLDRLLAEEPLATGDLILTEVLQGFRSDRDFQQARRLMSSLTVIEIGGIDVAVQAARNFRSLRSRGITIRKTIDTIIATRCIRDGFSLLHRDVDFKPFVEYLGLREVA